MAITQAEILEMLEASGHKWQDYFVIADGPSVCLGSKSQLAVLLIECAEKNQATVAFLRQRGAREYRDIAALKSAGGWDGGPAIAKPWQRSNTSET